MLMEQALQGLLERVFLLIPRVAISVLLALAFWLAARVVKNVLIRVGKRTGWAPDVIGLVAQASTFTLVVFGVITALGTVGINVSALVAGLGLTGFALGFALKDALSNVLAGALILSYRPFRRGERIEVQIRTREMHLVADWGIAAHWTYKEAARGTKDVDKLAYEKFNWLRELVTMHQQSTPRAHSRTQPRDTRSPFSK